MNKSFFGLRQAPVAGREQAAGIYWSQAHALAFDRLGFAVTSRAPLTVFTGADGSGRTTLLRELVARKRSERRIAMLDLSALLAQDPVAAALRAFGQSPPDGAPQDIETAYERFLDASLSEGAPPVLVIDDADQLTETTLPLLSRLATFGATDPVRHKLIVAGSLELFKWLYDRLPEVVGPTFELTEMSQNDTTGYIRHFLAAHRLSADIFDGDALADIHRCGGGLPRRINAICDWCLNRAAETDTGRIDRAAVRRAVIMLGFRVGRTGADDDFASTVSLPLDPSDDVPLGAGAATPVTGDLTQATEPAPRPPPEPQAIPNALTERPARAAPRDETWIGIGLVAVGIVAGAATGFLLSTFAASIWAEIVQFVGFR